MSANTILEKYELTYANLLADLTPDNINLLIKSDPTCLRQFGRGKVTSSYACEYCELLSHVVSFQKGVPKEIQINTGELRDKILRVEEHVSPITLAKWDETIQELHKKYKKGKENDTFEISDQYITVDPWTGSIIVGWILNNIYEEAGIQCVVPTIGFFICRDIGFRLVVDEDTPILKLDLNEENVIHLLLQLGTALRIVRHYYFSHAKASVDGLSFAMNPITYKYHTVNVDSPFTLYLTNFTESSIEWESVRIVSSAKGRYVDLKQAIQMNDSIIEKYPSAKIGKDGKVEHCTLWKLNPTHIGAFVTMRYSGYTFSSYDFYSHLTSLLSWKEFRTIVHQSIRIQSFLADLFPKKDFLRTWPTPEKTGLLTCPYQIAKVLSNYYLYDDVFDRFLKTAGE